MQLNQDEFTRAFEISDVELETLIAKGALNLNNNNHLDLYDKINSKWICENKMHILFFARINEIGLCN